MFVSDLGHFLDLPADAPGPAVRMADRLGRIVSAATAGDVGEPWTTAIRCERRPGRRPCSGFIEVVRAEPESQIRWWCNACDDEGVISGWEDTPFDLRQSELRVTGEQQQVRVDADMATVLHRLTVLDVEVARLVFRARVVAGGMVLAGSTDALEALAEYVAAEANHETHRRRRQTLDATFDVLDGALAGHR